MKHLNNVPIFHTNLLDMYLFMSKYAHNITETSNKKVVKQSHKPVMLRTKIINSKEVIMYKHELIIRKRKSNGKYQTILPSTRIFAEYDDNVIPSMVLLNITASELSQAKQTIEPGAHFITLFGGPYAGRDFQVTKVDFLPRNPHRLILYITPIHSEFSPDGYIEGDVKELHPPKQIIHCIKATNESNTKEV